MTYKSIEHFSEKMMIKSKKKALSEFRGYKVQKTGLGLKINFLSSIHKKDSHIIK